MPVHPDLVPVLELAGAMPPIESLSVAESRALAGARPATSEPEPVDAVTDLTVPGPVGAVAVRAYRPRGAPAAPLPVVAFFHGGGWVFGDLDSHDIMGRALANRSGALVVAVDYRLAPEHPWPAAADDAEAVTRWLADHADELGGDPARLAVAGDSAGGNLAAVVARRWRDARRAGADLPDLAAQVLIYPVTDHDLDSPSYLRNAEGLFLTRSAMAWFWDLYVPAPADRAHPDASPLRADDLTDLPPAVVVTAGYDPLLDDGERYADALAAAGVPVVRRCYDDMIHAFVSMLGLVDAADDALRLAATELRARFATAG
ncbi:MAG TPA: alpha/beta hydrolase [Acidimicrobiales bacterium]|nr:alpha/beta hydrolase [Acidimicrobiales bacterium]